MPKVTFIIDGESQTVEFEPGQLPYSHHGKPESFLDVAKNFQVPLEHACGGSCACPTCRARRLPPDAAGQWFREIVGTPHGSVVP